MAEARASLVLEVIDLEGYRAAVNAARKDTEALTEAQRAMGPVSVSTARARRDSVAATEKATAAEKALEKAYWASLAPHEKTAARIEKVNALHLVGAGLEEKRAKTVESLSLMLADQTRRFEMNRGEQNKLSRSLAELIDKQTKELLLGEKFAGNLDKMSSGTSKAAMGVGLMAAGATAAIAGIAALGTAIIANSAAADEYNEELRQFNLNLDATGTIAVNRAAAGLDAVGVAGKMMSVTFAESVAPAIEEGSTRVVAMGFAAVDAWKNFASGKDTLTIIAELVAKGLVGAFNALISPLKNAAIGLALLSDAVGVTDDAAINIRNTFDQFTESLEASTADGLAYMVKEGLKPLIAATDDYMGRAGDLVTKQEAITRATRDQTEAVAEAAEAWELYANKAVGANIEVLKSTEKASAAGAKAQKSSIDEVKTAALEAIEQEGSRRAQQIAFGVSLAQQAAQTTIALIEMVGGESAKAAMAAFVIEQAAALASIGIATAQNISKAAALFAFPSPAGIAAVAAVSALGAAQAGVVLGSAIGSYNSAPANAGAGATGGGGGLGISVGGGQNVPAASAVGMGGGTGNGGRPPPQLAIPSSDGYFPPTMGGRTIQTAPGDEAYVQRAGALNRDNQGGGVDVSELVSVMQALLTETRAWRQDDRVRRFLGARVAGPAGVF